MALTRTEQLSLRALIVILATTDNCNQTELYRNEFAQEWLKNSFPSMID